MHFRAQINWVLYLDDCDRRSVAFGFRRNRDTGLALGMAVVSHMNIVAVRLAWGRFPGQTGILFACLLKKVFGTRARCAANVMYPA